MKQFEQTLKALANRRRLAVIQHIKKNREVSVGGIAEAIKLSIKSTSRHLAILFAADVLEKEQRHTQVFYKLCSPQKSPAKEVVALL